MPVLLFIALVFVSFPTFAYMGPGAGLTAFGCLVALLAGVWYTFKGFLWLPLKRKFGKKTDAQQVEPLQQTTTDTTANKTATDKTS